MRTFIALDIDPILKDKLADLIRELDTGTKNIRWIKNQGMHLTLKFLGEVTPTTADEVKSALDRLAHAYPPLPLHLRGTGCFPGGSQPPRVLWVGIEPSPALSSLQQALEDELEKLGFPRENRSFHPHLTLGRVKVSSAGADLRARLKRHSDTEIGRMTSGRITLFESRLGPSGADYSILHEVAFR